jgi:hypothetical protein
VIRLRGSGILNHLDALARGSLEETRTGLIETIAKELCLAQRDARGTCRSCVRAVVHIGILAGLGSTGQIRVAPAEMGAMLAS